MKQDWEEEKLKRLFTTVKAQRLKHSRIWTEIQNLQPKLSQVDSPCILKSILNTKESKYWEKKQYLLVNLARTPIGTSKVFDEEELEYISENSNSIS